MSSSLQQTIVRELSLLLEPLLTAVGNPRGRRQLFEALGWQLEAIPGLSLQHLDETLTNVAKAYETAVNLGDSNEPKSLSDLLKVLRAIDDVWTAVEDLQRISSRLDSRDLQDLRHVGQELINFLSTYYLSKHHPALYELAILLTLIRLRAMNDAVVTGIPPQMVRIPHVRPEIRLDRLVPLLRDPEGFLKSDYLGDRGLETGEDAQRVADRIFPHLGGLLAALGVHAYYRTEPNPELGFDFGPDGNQLAPGVLAMFFPLPPDENGVQITVGGTLALSSADRGDLGLVVVPFGELDYVRQLARWVVQLKLTASVGAFAVGPRGLTLLAGANVASVTGEITATTLPGAAKEDDDSATEGDTGAESEDGHKKSPPAFVIGGEKGTHLEIGAAEISVQCSLDAKEQDYGFLATVKDAGLVVSPGDGDSFLQKVLPPDGLEATFDVALGWSKSKGLYFDGSAGLEVTIPVNKSLFGIVDLKSVYVSLETKEKANDEEAGVDTVLAVTGSLQLGPLTASVDRIGIESELTFPAEGGNLGPLNIEGPRFKSPEGLGLAIDSESIVGGGYLFFDNKKKEYAGVLQLELKESITLKAIGLLTTGSRNFSLLIIISAEGFTPIQLGYGFMLTGVGGLIGVNRTTVLQVLRAGIKQGTLDSILFPPDPVRNAPQIISNLRAVFPPAEGRYVFGPMAKIRWTTVLEIQLGIILELPAPVRLIIVGKFSASLPDAEQEDSPIQLRMDALGTVDFGSGDASVDATLYDSRLLQYVLTGDMAMRANWGASPTFVLAVGGFHPRFQAPPNFPALDRIALSLATGNNPRLRLESYFALTSNTAQFGARIDLYAKEGGFSIEGDLGFDTLFHFKPFDFVADVGGRVTVKHGGSKIAAVRIDMVLTGPSPLHSRGKATFEALGVKHSVRFSATFGGDDKKEVPAAVDVRPLLVAAVQDIRNWSGQLPADGHALVTFGQVAPSDAVLVHPLSALTLRQRVVPLGLTISRFGTSTPKGERSFSITRTNLGGKVITADPIRDHFAPAQFFEMSDDEKLSRPSFEPLQAGISIGRTALRYGSDGAGREVQIGYKTLLLDPEQPQPPDPEPAPQPLPAGAASTQAQLGAAARSPLRRTGRTKYRAVGRPVTVGDPLYVVSSVDSDEPQGVGDGAAREALPYAVLFEKLQAHLAVHPEDRARMQIRAARVGEAG